MGSKAIIYAGMALGGTIGGFIPMMWGDSGFSLTAVVLSFIGGVAGIVITYRMLD